MKHMEVLKPVRRIVTTHDATGKAVFLNDGPAEKVARPDRPIVNWPLWVLDTSPAECSGTEDFVARMTGLHPGASGVYFRAIDIPPTGDSVRTVNPRAAIEEHGLEAEAAKSRPPRHPRMHRTSTVDFGLILAGEVDLLLDEETRHLTVGDVVVMQATNHAWVNRGPEMCRIAFILIDAKDPL
jgi:hypothetical protein